MVTRTIARINWLVAVACLCAPVGCGTTRLTDTQRTATEQLLVSNAIDRAVTGLDFNELAGKSVYFDAQYLDGTVDRGYLVSTLRQALLANGCLLQEERSKATFVVEVRSGGVGTDRHAVLVGVPQMTVPAFVPGQPSQIPEIPLAKKTDQEGVAKLAVFAYNRQTGKLIWQSGMAQATSTSKDTWFLGAGPFQQGTIRNGTEFAGEQIPLPRLIDREINIAGSPPPVAPLAPLPAPEPTDSKTDSKRMAVLLGNVPAEERPRAEVASSATPPLNENLPFLASIKANRAWPWNQLLSEDAVPAPAAAPSEVKNSPAPPPATPNAGGQAESEPSKVQTSGLTSKTTTTPQETEPRVIWDTATGFKPDG